MPDIASVAGLRQERAPLAARLQELGTRTSSLSAEEQAEFDRLDGEIRGYDRRIAAAEADQRLRAGRATDRHGRGADADVAGAPLSIRTDDGRLLHARRHDAPLLAGQDLGAAADPYSDQISLGRLIRAQALGDWSAAQAERDYLAEVGATMQSNAGGGAMLIPDQMSSQIIDLSRNAMRVGQAGALTVPMTSNNLSFASVLRDPVAGWRGEGARFPKGEMTFGGVSMYSRTVGCVLWTTIELIEDAANLETLVRTGLANALALEWDRAALLGSGIGPEPAGIAATAGVTKQAAAYSTTEPTNAQVQAIHRQAVAPLLARNLDLASISWLYNSDYDLQLAAMMNAFGDPQRWTLLEKSRGALTTNQIPSIPTPVTSDPARAATTTLFAGDFSNLVLGVRTSITVEVSRAAVDTTAGDAENAFTEGKVGIRAYMRGDVGLLRPAHFTVTENVPVERL